MILKEIYVQIHLDLIQIWVYESPRGLDPNYDGPVWYVEGTGITYANGGPGAPYSTIMEGISAADDGDTVFVKEEPTQKI